MTSAAIGVVIPAYNAADFVGEAIESVLAQTLRATKIVVVDDGSSDDTANVVRRFGPEVDLVVQPNRGVAAARNEGARRCEADLLAFLDADDSWLPSKLELQAARFEADDVGMVHTGVVEVDEHGYELRTRLDGLSGSIAPDLVRWDRSAVLGGGSGAMFRASIFEQVGGFDERLSMSADWDLFFRVARIATVGFVSEPLLRYRVHGSNMSRNVGLLERDMQMALDKAFALAPELRSERRRSYANFAYAVGGGYLNEGRWWIGARRITQAILRQPSLISRVVQAARRRDDAGR